MDVMTCLYVWLAGVAVWTVFMGWCGEEFDFGFLISILMWPLLLLRLIGGLMAGKKLRRR